MINEFLVLQLSTNLLLFSDLVHDDDFKYNIAGWSYVTIMIIVLCLNVRLIIIGALPQIRINCKRIHRRLRPETAREIIERKEDVSRLHALTSVLQKQSEEQELEFNILSVESPAKYHTPMDDL